MGETRVCFNDYSWSWMLHLFPDYVLRYTSGLALKMAMSQHFFFFFLLWQSPIFHSSSNISKFYCVKKKIFCMHTCTLNNIHYLGGKKVPTWISLSKQVRAFHWIITAVNNMFQLATGYLTPTDALNSLFLKAPCRKTHPVFVEKMLFHV